MRSVIQLAKFRSLQVWWALRQIFGDAAYENYLRSIQRNAALGGNIATPLSRDEFYLDSLQRKYSKVSRCC